MGFSSRLKDARTLWRALSKGSHLHAVPENLSRRVLSSTMIDLHTSARPSGIKIGAWESFVPAHCSLWHFVFILTDSAPSTRSLLVLKHYRTIWTHLYFLTVSFPHFPPSRNLVLCDFLVTSFLNQTCRLFVYRKMFLHEYIFMQCSLNF